MAGQEYLHPNIPFMHTHTLSASNIHLDELISDAIVAAGERQYLAEPKN